MANIEIETSTDTVEEVQEALKGEVEIEESPAAEPEEETPAAEDQEESEEGEEKDEPEEGSAEAEEDEEEPEEKPAKKGTTPMVPTARLNAEIKRRKDLERQLAERDEIAGEEEDDKPEAKPEAKPAAEAKPGFQFKEPKPKFEDFTKGVDELDPKAMATASAQFSEALSDWADKKAEAHAEYKARVQEAQKAWEELTEPFIERRELFAKQNPEVSKIINKSQIQLTPDQQAFVYGSAAGPQMLAYFTEHPRSTRMNHLNKREWSQQMLEVEEKAIKKYGAIKEEGDDGEPEEEAEEPKPKAGAPTKRTPTTPTKKPVAAAPLPPDRLKSQGQVPKSMQELAGPTDRTGIDIEYSKEFEKADKARRGVT